MTTLFAKLMAPKTATPTLDLYATDFTALAKLGTLDPVIGRETEVLKLSRVLARRTKNNAVLLGDPGVGKTAIVEGLAQRIVQNQVPDEIQGKRVLALNVSTLLAGTKYRGELETRAKQIITELTRARRSIILFVDEVHSLVQTQGSEGAINLSDIFKPALAKGELQMIGATTKTEYNKYFRSDPSLERRFQPILIAEPSAQETLTILQGVKDKYREHHHVEFTDAALVAAVRLTKKLIKTRKLPDKAIDALDEAAAMVKVSHVDTMIPALLFQAAVKKYPELKKVWREVQALDAKLLAGGPKLTMSRLIGQRERLEQSMMKKGVLTVDSADVERVVTEWTQTC